MSKFLAPIHTWLFNKIVLFEEIEIELINKYEKDNSKDISSIVSSNRAKFGELLPNVPVEEIIDLGNIHGWLQAQINVVETRQAGIITNIIENDGKLNDSIVNAYETVAIKAATDLKGTAKVAGELHKILNNFLLEGMPCDRVNVVVDQTDDIIVWETSSCLHKKFWDEVGGDIKNYYTLRSAFTNKLLNEINEDFEYTFTNDEKMTHTIKRK